MSSKMVARALRWAPVSSKGSADEEPSHERLARPVGGGLGGRHLVADRAGVAFEGPPAQDEDQLQPEQLIEDEALTRRPRLVGRLGLVDRPHGLGATPEPQLAAERARQRVGEGAGAVERLLDIGPDLPAGEARLGRRRVDRDDLEHAALGLAALDARHEVDDRVGHLAPAPVLGELAPDEELGARGELLLAPGLVEEDEREVAGLVGHHRLHPLAPSGIADRTRPLDVGEDDGLVADGEIGDVGRPGPVDVAARIGGEQVQHGGHPPAGQGLGVLRLHRLQLGDRDVGQLGEASAGAGSPLGHSTPKRYGYSG